MVRFRVVVGRRERDQRGPVIVESREWAIGLNAPHAAIGVSYRHPTRVVDAGGGRRILDHLMLVRVASATLVALALTCRRFHR